MLRLANKLNSFACGLHTDVTLLCFFFPIQNERSLEDPMILKQWLAFSVQPSSY